MNKKKLLLQTTFANEKQPKFFGTFVKTKKICFRGYRGYRDVRVYQELFRNGLQQDGKALQPQNAIFFPPLPIFVCEASRWIIY